MSLSSGAQYPPGPEKALEFEWTGRNQGFGGVPPEGAAAQCPLFIAANWGANSERSTVGPTVPAAQEGHALGSGGLQPKSLIPVYCPLSASLWT